MKILIKILCLSVLWFSCEEPGPDVYGCTDETACNFIPDANIFDNSCIYDTDSDGICDDVDDCIDINQDDICDSEQVYGCTDPNADNYDSNATIFDNSCLYSESNFEVRTVQIGVLEKMYTVANPYWVTVFYDDDETDYSTVVIFATALNINDLWVNVESYGSYYSSTAFMCTDDFSFDEKCGFAALIYDPDQDLLGKELKLWYIP